MKSYKVQRSSPYVRRFRILSAVAILALLGISFLAVCDPLDFSDATRKPLAGLAIAVAALVVFSVGPFSYLQGVWKLKCAREFEVSSDRIIERRSDTQSTLDIPFDKIKSLSQYSSWLVIESEDQPKRMMIPREVEGFEELRAQLLATRQLESPRVASPLWSFLPILLLVSASLLLFLGRNASVVLASGGSLLCFEAWGVYSLVRIHRGRRIPKFTMLMWIVAVLFVCWITYSRAHGLLSVHWTGRPS